MKLIRLIWVLLLLSVSSLAQNTWVQTSPATTTVSVNGVSNVLITIPNATVTVCTSVSILGTCSVNLIPLCSSQISACTGVQGGGGDSANPFTADAFGNFGFWVAPGQYKYMISATGVTAQIFNLSAGASGGGSSGIVGSPTIGTQVIGNGTAFAVQAKPLIDVRDYGTFADNTNGHTITSGNIGAHTEWLGCGTVSTSGTTVTWVSGAKFLPQFGAYGLKVNINGTDYTVASVGAVTGGVATSMTLTATAGTQTGARFCQYSTGDQWDYVGLQESIFTANKAPGSELSNGSQWQGKGVTIPCGSYKINKPLIVNRGAGLHIDGIQRFCVEITQISNNTPVFETNGFAYSRVNGIEFFCSGISATVPCLNVDYDGGGAPGISLQGNTFQDDYFTGNLNWNVGFFLAQSGFQGSENNFIADHFNNFQTRCYYQVGHNALQNSFFGGNFQNCAGDGLATQRGTVDIHDVGFQNGTVTQTGYDINLNSGGSADSINTIDGVSRSESRNFLQTAAGSAVTVNGAHQNPAQIFAWSANTSCATFNGHLVIPPTNSTQYIGSGFTTTSNTGTTGNVEPTWSYSGVVDNNCTWVYTPLTFANLNGPSKLTNNESQGGSVFMPSNLAGDPFDFHNNIFSHGDWFNPNVTGANNAAFVNRTVLSFDHNIAFFGGNANSGGALVDFSPVSSGTKSIQIGDADFHLRPLIFGGGTGGTQESDCGIGLGRNKANTTAIYPESILALMSPAAQNCKLGRLDANGANQTGANQDIAGGRGTGTGLSGIINFWLHGAGGSGSTPGTLVNTAQVTQNGYRTIPVAFASLASCVAGVEGTMAAVTDSNTATWGVTVANGGTNHILAYCDGTNWTVAGK